MASNGAHQSHSIMIVCDQHDNHGPFCFSEHDDLVVSNSRLLGHQFSTSEHPILLRYSGCEYDCSTLRSMIKTWINREYRPLPHVDTFVALSQLSKALWDYQCWPNWFLNFANDVREQHWPAHFRGGVYSGTWAFIALVFGWEDVFGCACMDIPSLGLQPHLKPEPYEYSEIAAIVGEEDYDNQFSSTYEFVRNTCGRLESTNRQVFDRVIKCFRDKDIAILTAMQGSIDTLRPLGVVGLLRMFESFLEHDTGTANHRVIPRGNRYPQRPFLWRMASSIRHTHNSQAEEAASIVQNNSDPTERDLILRIKEHRESSLSRFLERNNAAGDRFRTLRRERLILHGEGANSDRITNNAGNTLPGEIAHVEASPRELPAWPSRSPTQTAVGCFHPPCSCRATTPPASSSSSHHL